MDLSTMASRSSSTTANAVSATSPAHIVHIVLFIAKYPFALALRIVSMLTVQPVAYSWRLFVRVFESIIKPIFYFAAVAGLVGAVSGLAVGGLALLVQWLIPVKRIEYKVESSKVKQAVKALKHTNNMSTSTSSEELLSSLSAQSSGPTTPTMSLSTSSSSATINEIPSTFTTASPIEQPIGYEDEDGYSSYTPRRIYHPQMPDDADYDDGDDDALPRDQDQMFVHFFSPIREESEDEKGVTAFSTALHNDLLHQRKNIKVH